MSEVHQWLNKYNAPLSPGQVISASRPGEQIAKAISEIQGVISSMQGADEEDDASDIEDQVADLATAVANLAEIVASFSENSAGVSTDIGAADGMVWQKQGGTGVWDWMRAIA